MRFGFNLAVVCPASITLPRKHLPNAYTTTYYYMGGAGQKKSYIFGFAKGGEGGECLKCWKGGGIE